jgi:hypothetical protein
MTIDTPSSRRSFLKGGALIAAPLLSMPTAALANDDALARLARLEDEAAVRAAHYRWLRDGRAELAALALGAATVTPDHDAEPLAIEVAGDGRSAITRQTFLVKTAAGIEPDCTFAQMALAQGNACAHDTERRILTTRFVSGDRGWTMADATLA